MTISSFSRRDFLKRSAVVAASIAAGKAVTAWAGDSTATRFVFLTDIHLMQGDAMGSDKGLAACLDAIEALRPRPEFILCGGDLTHESPDLDFDRGAKLIDRFLGIWHDHTALPTHFAFGNHDFAGSRNPSVAHDDSRFGKGLWQQRLGLERSYYGFDAGNWRFVVLDDVSLNADGSFTGVFPDEQLDFLKGEVVAAAGRPLVLCGHIPSMSVFPIVTGAAKLVGAKIETSTTLVANNAKSVLEMVKGARGDLKLVLAGHLHHYEQIDLDGVRFLNSGAVCGNWWKGAHLGCPEGFLVVDIQPDGKFAHHYQPYGWNAAAHQAG